MKKISIIVPIYNTGKYLADCLDSILKNDYLNEIEIVLVNDGSTDNSEEICKKYLSRKECDIKYIKIKNSGLSEARNNGLKSATAELIWFVDSDDMISSSAIKKIIENEGRHDILMVGYSLLTNGTSSLARQDDTEDVISKYIINTPIVPIRIFRKKFLDRIGFRFQKGRFYEDTGSMYGLVKYTKDIQYIDEAMYIYRKREGSIIMDKNIESKSRDRFWAAEEILKNVPDEYAEEKRYQVIKTIGLFYSFDILNNVTDKKDRNRLVSEARKYLEEKVPRYWKNKYLRRKNVTMRCYRLFLWFFHRKHYGICKLISAARTRMI